MEIFYGGHLTIGPPVEDGFYYDMCAASSRHASARPTPLARLQLRSVASHCH